MSMIHIATLDDLEKLIPMVESYHIFEGLDVAEDARRTAVRALLADRSLGVILLIGPSQSPVGYMALTFGFSIELGGRDAFIDEFFIREKVRGKGVGTQVLSVISQIMAEFEIQALHLEVAKTNEAAIRKYLKAGFTARDRYTLMSRGQ